jgi:hypothetical protein
LFGITDSQLLDLHDTIDRRFEKMVTDTLDTDELFKSKKQKPFDLLTNELAIHKNVKEVPCNL